ncbi:hypothetical protein C8R44DRAFT_984385 [Mycena epipterygia]|nr:hypothetical protein C8R44DRAFT_984385 [Mycena epipterygia]
MFFNALLVLSALSLVAAIHRIFPTCLRSPASFTASPTPRLISSTQRPCSLSLPARRRAYPSRLVRERRPRCAVDSSWEFQNDY